MPVDPTRASSSRRTQRKITEEELKDIELKRIRGELSCAECRRLKLRCDKKVPCSSCCRRGCESICPCGVLSAGQGTRFILADTDQLHRKIADMSHRIRQLEDALAILQSSVSSDRHPLLQDELLKIKFGPEAPDARRASLQEDDKDTKQSIDALGTLTLGDSGEVKYFGRSAGSETLMMAEEEWDSSNEDEDEEGRIQLTPELENLANLFPFTSKYRPNRDLFELLETFLPSRDRGSSLSDSYINHATYFFRPIKRDELTNILIPLVYNAASARISAGAIAESPPGIDQSSDSGSINTSNPHALATIFFIFALGALLDLNLPPYNAEAEHYYDLGRAALSLRTVFESPQVDTIQALGLMATYHSLAGKKYSRDSAWCVMSLVAKLAQSIGLHRDSARWHMDPLTVQKRRTLFWEVFSADVSHSLALGRPPAIHLSYVDCELPEDEEATLSDSGEIQNGFWRMKYTFGREMFLAVAETTLTATSPSYTTVLNLDRKVREITFPTSFKPYVLREDGEQEYFSSSLSLQGFYASQHRTVTMLYLHRSFFAQAMLDHPSNPLLSPFAPSFLTAYRCASIIIKASVHQFDRCAEMAMRVWFLMYHTFSAAIIVGTVVTRSPNSSVAASALLDLTQAVDLFERTALQSQRAKIALGVLRRLKERAIRSYTQYSSALTTEQNTDRESSSSLYEPQTKEELDNKLAIFGGQTRVLSRKSRSKNLSSSMGSPPSSSESPGSPPAVNAPADTGPNTNEISMSDVHPALIDYLSSESLSTGQGLNLAPGVDPGRMLTGATAMRQIDDLFSSFVEPTTSASNRNDAILANPAVPNPNSIPNLYHSNQSTDQSGWGSKLDTSGLPQADNSFGWLPPFMRQPNSARPSLLLNPSGTTSEYINIPTSTGSLRQLPDQMTFAQPAYSDVQWQPNYNSGNLQEGGLSAAPAGHGTMVELGLMTESEIDSGWFSFMQDCGIMEFGNEGDKETNRPF